MSVRLQKSERVFRIFPTFMVNIFSEIPGSVVVIDTIYKFTSTYQLGVVPEEGSFSTRILLDIYASARLGKAKHLPFWGKITQLRVEANFGIRIQRSALAYFKPYLDMIL
ncbi:hypothetical protein Tco_1104743 [Tanacetum coccineum]